MVDVSKMKGYSNHSHVDMVISCLADMVISHEKTCPPHQGRESKFYDSFVYDAYCRECVKRVCNGDFHRNSWNGKAEAITNQDSNPSMIHDNHVPSEVLPRMSSFNYLQ